MSPIRVVDHELRVLKLRVHRVLDENAADQRVDVPLAESMPSEVLPSLFVHKPRVGP